jgi:cytidine deaminase
MAEPTGFPPEASELIDEAVRAAHQALGRAYAPYSGFPIGAAIVAGGRIFTGVNVENASYPVSMCAERNAIAAMVNGGERRVDAIAVASAGARPTPPCGACRQVLWELGPSSIVVAETAEGSRVMWALEDLLPEAFGPSDLG